MHGHMPQLYHHPLCPQSRFARLALAEYGVEAKLVEERTQERRHDFLLLNPAGQTPVLQLDEGTAISGAAVIGEYLDEAHGAAAPARRLMPEAPLARAETRRLVSWFCDKFFDEVSRPLVNEKIYKRFLPPALGGGGPDMELVRAARFNIRAHLRYIGWLVSTRHWLAGETLSLADFAAAAHISSVDYLGDAPFAEDAGAKEWYARIKSRPSFRSLLNDRAPGLPPPQSYADLDF